MEPQDEPIIDIGPIVTGSAKTGTPMTYQQIYGALMRRFTVASYTDIPDDCYEEVMMFLRSLWRTATSGTQPEQGSMFS